MVHEARWIRPAPRFQVGVPFLQRMTQFGFPNRRIAQVEPITEGLRNANFKLQLDGMAESVVLRIYEHDPSLCRKELDLMRLLSPSVPVPQVIHAEPSGFDDLPPFAILRYVEGVTFHELKRRGDPKAIAQAAYSVGETLAAIGRFSFSRPGWLGPGPTVLAPIDCDASRLVHGDFSKRNLLVAPVNGLWSVAAVLDWEFALSGSPLTDIGSFLRYERADRPLLEPHFSAGYQTAGGDLPLDWRRRVRVVDLIALRRSLTQNALPEAIAMEIAELINATVEDRDPNLPPQGSGRDSAHADESGE